MFSERMKELREANRMEQTALAAKLGVSKQSVSNWENNNILPSIEMLLKICDVFSVSADYLLGRSNEVALDVSDISLDHVAHLRAIIDALPKKQKERNDAE